MSRKLCCLCETAIVIVCLAGGSYEFSCAAHVNVSSNGQSVVLYFEWETHADLNIF